MRLSNMHRIHWFDQQIRAERYPNSSRLAERFEISKRQAQRDIEYMESSLRAPLAYVAKRRGYCYEDQTYVLPHLYMTEEEKQILQYLAYRYGQYDYDNADAIHRIAHLLGKITENDPEADSHAQLPVFEMDPVRIQHFQLLSQAIQENRVVQIAYKHLEEDCRLTVWPLKIFAQYNVDYVRAYCEQLNVTRPFRMEGIRHLALAAEKFDRSKLDAKSWIDDASPIRKPFTARIVLSKLPNGNAWGGYAARPVEGHLYEIDFYDTNSLLQHLFVSPEWKELLSPQWLRAKLRSRAEAVFKQLNDGDPTTIT